MTSDKAYHLQRDLRPRKSTVKCLASGMKVTSDDSKLETIHCGIELVPEDLKHPGNVAKFKAGEKEAGVENIAPFMIKVTLFDKDASGGYKQYKVDVRDLCDKPKVACTGLSAAASVAIVPSPGKKPILLTPEQTAKLAKMVPPPAPGLKAGNVPTGVVDENMLYKAIEEAMKVGFQKFGVPVSSQSMPSEKPIISPPSGKSTQEALAEMVAVMPSRGGSLEKENPIISELKFNQKFKLVQTPDTCKNVQILETAPENESEENKRIRESRNEQRKNIIPVWIEFQREIKGSERQIEGICIPFNTEIGLASKEVNGIETNPARTAYPIVNVENICKAMNLSLQKVPTLSNWNIEWKGEKKTYPKQIDASIFTGRQLNDAIELINNPSKIIDVKSLTGKQLEYAKNLLEKNQKLTNAEKEAKRKELYAILDLKKKLEEQAEEAKKVSSKLQESINTYKSEIDAARITQNKLQKKIESIDKIQTISQEEREKQKQEIQSTIDKKSKEMELKSTRIEELTKEKNEYAKKSEEQKKLKDIPVNILIYEEKFNCDIRKKG